MFTVIPKEFTYAVYVFKLFLMMNLGWAGEEIPSVSVILCSLEPLPVVFV
jgi:hypothetical protein